MKKNILLIVLLTNLISFGQIKDYTITKSRVFIEPFEKTKLITVIEDNSGSIHTVRYYDEFVSAQYNHENSKGFIVQQWDSLQNSISYNNYKIETHKKGILSGLYINQDKLYVLEYVKNKKDKAIDCFVHISLDDKNEFERKKVFSVNVKQFPGFVYAALNNKIDTNYQGNMVFSQNGERIAFHIDSDSKDHEKHKIHVFNNKFETLWEKEFTQTEKDRLFDIKQVKIDNKGDVYILGKVFHNKRKNEVKNKINYHLEIFKVSEDKTETTHLEFKNNPPINLNLTIDEAQIHCIGITSKRTNLNKYNITGTFYFLIDKHTMQITKSNFQQFSPEFITNKYDSKGYKGTGQYLIKNIETLDNGYIIVAEEFLIKSSGNIGMNSNSYTSFNFNDIAIIRLNKSGDLVWAKNINKHQIGYNYNDKLVSSSILTKKDDTYIFLNERKNVKSIKNNLTFENGNFGNITKQNSNLYAVKIDGQGNISSDAIHLNKFNDIMFYPRNGKPSYNSQMVIFGSNKKQKQFLTFKIK